VGTKRLFVSLEFPATVAAILADLDPGMRGVRWVRAEQVHLTLAFLGNVEAEVQSNLQNQLKTIQFTHFFTPLQGIGVFPARDRPKIVWVGVGHGHPHITLARCQDVSGQALQPFLRRHADLDLGVLPIEEFHLKSSRLTPAGSIYTTEFTVAAS
jgi:2'-5' RNA ligase